ncbi:MAG: Daunorubicin/doxorubicin resistance ATP-binding protein DrrA [Betaproteobacteria bacterium]|jgi:lipooligosaccharide transport system ATP-binding protein|nr:Daunorubicin/doxorubicin resistance ATP-binding protein DrrA [Betaproteobacteria bacterium]MEA3153713.1 lipooligosaccharide transport system ATP-binding protein [Betaproteobacteria bacterium]
MRHLRVANLRKSYDAMEVVAGLDLEIEAGVCFGLLGPNGAGKTTTLRLCLGLSEPDSGEIAILGFAVPEHAREARARIGVVPQVDNLDPDFSVRENLLVYGSYFGLRQRDIEARIPDLLEFAGLTSREHARIQTLSGGMKRRLTLARALVNDPQLMFLDEPSTGLDPQARHLIWERLRKLTSEGRTIVLTTHFMDEAERLCHRVAIIDHGRKIAEGTPRELITQYIEPQVVEVYGDGAEAWAETYGRSASERCEKTGETFFCYTRDADAIVHALDRESNVRYLHRPANLEDVFLKLTGRELRD